ncbi:MAG: FHA domain-containing protein [Actinomycetota bacterium]|nr:FHA domain-containing protein [Actinomycetota bacterium]
MSAQLRTDNTEHGPEQDSIAPEGPRAGEPAHAWLVLYQPGRAPRTVALSGELTVGRHLGQPDTAGHLAIQNDPAVSRLHALFVHKAPGWCVQAAASTNGLFLDGVRMANGAVQLLAPGDEIRLGEHTRLVFHDLHSRPADRSHTQTARPVPDLTPAERRVLLCLCSPVLDGDAFTPPATVAAIAAMLYVTESAIKQQLGRLYLKFGVDDGPERRVRLANDALTRGAVRRADLQSFRSETGGTTT